MKVTSSYCVKLLSNQKELLATIKLYRQAVSELVTIINAEWDSIKVAYNDGKLQAQRAVEVMVHATSNHPTPKYNFDKKFYKMPTYLRRAAISCALGSVSSYQSNYVAWVNNGKIGKPPMLANKGRHDMPAFFRRGMGFYDKMLLGEMDSVCLKLYNGSDWVWVTIPCRRQDVKYLAKYWSNVKSCAPVLEMNTSGRYSSNGYHKSGISHKHKTCCKKFSRSFSLRFAFEEARDLTLRDEPIESRIALAVDMGINTAATCSVMKSDGTVIARKFIDFPIEKDRMNHLLNKVKRAQREHGRTGGKHEWQKAMRISDDMARKVASAIVDFAVEYGVNVIVFEYLDTQGKKHGSKKERLHLWRKRTIQEMVTHKAHLNLIRVSHVCAWNTSKLAFDGSGTVTRFISNNGQKKNYSLCVLPSGKQYNCDLNASYNIGARYFLREMCTTKPVLKDKLPATSQRCYADLRMIQSVTQAA